jgi:hypothetical protein
VITACCRKMLYGSSAKTGRQDTVKGMLFDTASLLLHLSAYFSRFARAMAAHRVLNAPSHLMSWGRGGLGESHPLCLVPKIVKLRCYW